MHPSPLSIYRTFTFLRQRLWTHYIRASHPPPPLPFWNPLFCFLSLQLWLRQTPHVWAIHDYEIWLLSPRIVLSGFIYFLFNFSYIYLLFLISIQGVRYHHGLFKHSVFQQILLPSHLPDPCYLCDILSPHLCHASCVPLPPPILPHYCPWIVLVSCLVLRDFIYLRTSMYTLQKHMRENMWVLSFWDLAASFNVFFKSILFLPCDLVLPLLDRYPKTPYPTTGILTRPC